MKKLNAVANGVRLDNLALNTTAFKSNAQKLQRSPTEKVYNDSRQERGKIKANKKRNRNQRYKSVSVAGTISQLLRKLFAASERTSRTSNDPATR